ncbi:MAG TPA: ABC transporter permease [Thermomicrobiales bacterium]|nr:ABC transporter permease [Thermomicrobiales bacterium]
MSATSQSGVATDVCSDAADRPLPATPASLDVGPARRHDTMLDLLARRFLRHRLAVIGLIVLTVLIASALLAPLITQDPNALSVSERELGPSWDHLLGTDEAGRDILARTLHGGRISLTIGLAATLIALAIGTGLGAAAGYFGGPLDALLMRLTDAFLCFPQLFVLIVLGTLIRTTELRVLQGSIAPIALVIGVLSWMGLARLVRATFLSLKEKEFVEAARAAGSGNARIMLRHVLPGAVGPIVVQASLLVAASIITESGLSYLGYGVLPPTATWGNLLRDAQPHMQQLPIFAIAPGMMIFLTVMSINFVGDGLRDALDPYGRR